MLSKETMTEAIVAAKAEKNITWQALADKLGRSEVWVASACLGQNTMSKEEAQNTADLMGLGPDVVAALQVFPTKGAGHHYVPTDPLLYRFFEICYVYGPTIKEIINEKLGDGIMSAIDFSMDIEKVEDPKGDRVKVTMNGKFLPYKKW